MAVAVAKAVEAGARAIVCASTGNTAASAAAYAARAGIEAVIVHAAGGPASSKLAQVRAAGARLVEVEGTFDDAFAAAEELAGREGAVVVNSTNPDRIEGQKTAALEIIEQLGGPPDRARPPLRRRRQHGGVREGLPGGRVPGARDRLRSRRPTARRQAPLRSASRLRSTAPRWTKRSLARGSTIVSVTDDEIAVAWRSLARRGRRLLRACIRSGAGRGRSHGFAEGTRVVFVLTGHGLKDPDALDRLPGAS